MVIGVASTDPSITFTEDHGVFFYDTTAKSYRWSQILTNTDLWLNVYFADSDSKVLIVWADNSLGSAYWTFAFLDSTDGSLIGNMYQQDKTGGKIDHQGVAIKSDASSIYFMTNFPNDLQGTSPVGHNTITALSFDGTNWTKAA